MLKRQLGQVFTDHARVADADDVQAVLVESVQKIVDGNVGKGGDENRLRDFPVQLNSQRSVRRRRMRTLSSLIASMIVRVFPCG